MYYKVLDSCRYVMNNSQYVKIDYKKLDQFISQIDTDNLKNWLLFNPYNLLELGVEKIVNFLLFFEAIDYSFFGEPKWIIKTDEGYKDGSDALMYIMLKYIKENNNYDFDNLTFNEFSSMLSGNIKIPLLKERYDTLNQISKVIKEKMGGNFYNYIKNVTTDNELLSLIISNFESFKDEREYNGKTIYFYKLAQLLTSDILHIREELENINVTYSNLIGCADYKIPQTLRALGIIKYDQRLSEIVDSRKEIPISSKYEVEIRASQIVVIDYIKSKLNNVNAIDINDFLFLYSKKVKDIAKPYHLCRNTNY